MQPTVDSGALVADLGFLLRWDIPTPDHEAVLAIALRDRPTERHYDPELIGYWRTGADGRCHRAELTAGSHAPVVGHFAWGPIELIDRFGVRNTFIAFGGALTAERTELDRLTVTFSSRAPIFRRGGHSQRYDHLAAMVTAFFARILVPIDFEDGAEAHIASRPPIELYAAFLHHEVRRIAAAELVRDSYGVDARLVRVEAERMARHDTAAWRAGAELLERIGLAPRSADGVGQNGLSSIR